MVVRRGEIWWAQLDAPYGSEPGYRRPVLVVQSDAANVSRISTILVAPLTSNLLHARLPGNVLLPSGSAGLSRDSVVHVYQVVAIDRGRILGRIGSMPAELMLEVDYGLREALDLAMFES